METSAERFLKQTDLIASEPPRECKWNVGDKVKFTNDHGVEFGPYHVVGFAKPAGELGGRFIYIDYDCAWFPVRPDQLEKWAPKQWLVRDNGCLFLIYADIADEGLQLYKDRYELKEGFRTVEIERLPGPEQPVNFLWAN